MHDVQRLDLSLDALGGSAVSEAPSRTIIQEPALRALDVTKSPDLRQLDLQHCGPGLHLTLTNAPELRHVLLPDTGPGAVVHLDASTHTPNLVISGRLASVDACFKRGTGRLDCGQEGAFRRVVIGQRLPVDADAAIILHATPAELRSLDTAIQLQQLALIGCALGGTEDFRAFSKLRRLRIEQGTPCQSIHLPLGFERLDIGGLPDLTEIGGSGELLGLRNCETATLWVQGGWGQVLVDGGTYEQLDALLAESMELRRGADVEYLTVGRYTRLTLYTKPPQHIEGGNVNFETATDHAIMRLLHNYIEGQPNAEDDLRWFFSRPATGMGCLHRLHGLRRMIGEISPRFLWELRCYSHAAHQPRHRRHQLTMQQAMDFAGSLWRWRFPSDLEGEGWMADLSLAEAANGSGIVAPFLRDLGRVNQLGPVKGLALYIYAAKQQGRLNALPEAFVSGFRSSLQRLIFRVRSPSRQLPAAADLQPILRGLVILKDGRLAEQLRRRIQYWNEPAGQLALLGYLAAHGLSAARADLIALAQQPVHRFMGGNISQQAWRAALAAPQSDALAFTDTTEQEFFL